MEGRTGNGWRMIIAPRAAVLNALTGIFCGPRVCQQTQCAVAHHHVEGRAPMTLTKIREGYSFAGNSAKVMRQFEFFRTSRFSTKKK
jgi:hypothetical protein